MYIFALVSELIWIFILFLSSPGELCRRPRCYGDRTRVSELLQQRHIYECLERDPLRGRRRHYIDIENQLTACNLCGWILRRVEAGRARYQRSTLDERSDEGVRAGEDRINQRVPN